jgi:molybdenum cofactor guanylyltransferase
MVAHIGARDPDFSAYSTNKFSVSSTWMDPIEISCSGAILTGGLGKRLSGRNKALIRVGKQRIIDHIWDVYQSLFDEIMIIGNNPLDYLEWNAYWAADILPVRCSLTGIHAALFYAERPFVFVSACDTPFLKPALIRGIIAAADPAAAIVIPQTRAGFEPLCALYARKCLKPIERMLRQDRFKIQGLFKQVKTQIIPEETLREFDPDLVSFCNINTPEDIQTACRQAERQGPCT